MTINFDGNDNIKKNINTQIRQTYKKLNTDVKKVEIQFVSSESTVSEKEMAEIMGARFDGKIGATMQSFETGDCWILTGVNSLNNTDWGKEIIKNAIKPDGQGGAVVTLRGAEGENESFHVTIDDFEQADKNEKYSVGDYDMTAIELAVEKYAKQQIKSGKLNKSEENAIDGGIKITAAELLTGEKPHFYPEGDPKTENVLKRFMEQPNEYAVTCAFKENEPPLYSGHAYAMSGINTSLDGKKIVTLINPWDSSEEVKVPYDKFKSNLNLLLVTENPSHKDNSLKSQHELDIEIMKENIANYAARLIRNSLAYGSEETVQSAMNQITKDNVMMILENNNTKNIVKDIDKFKSGWGNGKAKKALMLPLINALAEKAEKVGVDKKDIENFKKECINKELDAIIYTNADKINAEVEKIKRLILNHE